jgi:hypothetical protein
MLIEAKRIAPRDIGFGFFKVGFCPSEIVAFFLNTLVNNTASRILKRGKITARHTGGKP